jgi:hypothetical protein
VAELPLGEEVTMFVMAEPRMRRDLVRILFMCGILLVRQLVSKD